jgi:hypothetical protein
MVDIYEGVSEIGSFAFADCTSLTDIKIPKTVTKIGYGAFAGCTNLKYVKIPKDKNYDTKWTIDCPDETRIILY